MAAIPKYISWETGSVRGGPILPGDSSSRQCMVVHMGLHLGCLDLIYALHGVEVAPYLLHQTCICLIHIPKQWLTHGPSCSSPWRNQVRSALPGAATPAPPIGATDAKTALTMPVDAAPLVEIPVMPISFSSVSVNREQNINLKIAHMRMCVCAWGCVTYLIIGN